MFKVSTGCLRCDICYCCLVRLLLLQVCSMICRVHDGVSNGQYFTCCSSLLLAGASQNQHQAAAPDLSNVSQKPLGSKTIPYVQPGCTVMYLPGQWCVPRPSPSVKGCCTPGHICAQDSTALTGRSCKPAPKTDLQYSFEQQAKGGCSMYVDVGGQCGGAGFDCYKYNTCDQFGPWARWCCPNGYSCQPVGQDFRLWTCQVNVQDSEPGKIHQPGSGIFCCCMISLHCLGLQSAILATVWQGSVDA